MVDLQGDLINLRVLNLEDLAFLYSVENNKDLWELSQTNKPFSKDVLHKYLETAHKDINEIKQLRLMITSKKLRKIILNLKVISKVWISIFSNHKYLVA